MTKTSTLALYANAAEITKAIASIQKRGVSLQNDIHRAALSCLVHTEKHGDITLANRLIDALPGMARKNALADWFVAFGKFLPAEDDKNGMLVFGADKVSMISEATATPFWEFKPEPKWVPFDFDKAVTAILKKAEAARKKGEEVPEDRITKLRELLTVDAE